MARSRTSSRKLVVRPKKTLRASVDLKDDLARLDDYRARHGNPSRDYAIRRAVAFALSSPAFDARLAELERASSATVVRSA